MRWSAVLGLGLLAAATILGQDEVATYEAYQKVVQQIPEFRRHVGGPFARQIPALPILL